MKILKQIWDNIVLVLIGVGIFLAYLLDRKSKRIIGLQTELALAKTKEEVKLVEKDIQALREVVKDKEEEVKEVDKLLEVVYNKKVTLAQEAGKLTPKEIEDFWNE